MHHNTARLSSAWASAVASQPAWWSDAVGYQVYLPSFADSDGDGWGDLDGLRDRLDHLVDLGVDLVWLTPFFVSPMRDHGYDIADYRRVDPLFGGEPALTRLLTAAHQRGLRVIGDLVVNHTSDQHPWFQSAVIDPAGPYRDYYLWRDAAPDGGPPNNWLSHFGGPAWTRDDVSGQYYLHLFHPQQPDLNWRNPAVADEVDGIIEHWLQVGLDGFRIDTAAYLVKHPDLLDNPVLPDGRLSPVRGVTTEWRRQDHRYDIHQPDVHAIHARWRRVADRYDAFLVGEIYELDPTALATYVSKEHLHSTFWFGLVEDEEWDPARIRTMLRAATTASPQLSWAQGNHDRARAASRYGNDHQGVRRSIALHVLTAFLPGTAWIYQGEELGLTDGIVAAEAGTDPLAVAEPSKSRDVARTPMPWASVPGLGFTVGKPWLPEGGRSARDTVEMQATQQYSPLATVRRMLAVRRDLLQLGDVGHPSQGLDWIQSRGSVVMYRRGNITVAANLGTYRTALPTQPGMVAFDTDNPDLEIGGLRPLPHSLRPLQAVVISAGPPSDCSAVAV